MVDHYVEKQVEDARAAMALYQRVKEEWEKSLRFNSKKPHKKDNSSLSEAAEKDVKTGRSRKLSS